MIDYDAELRHHNDVLRRTHRAPRFLALLALLRVLTVPRAAYSEVELLYRVTGFSMEGWFGDYAQRALRATSRQLIGVGRKAVD